MNILVVHNYYKIHAGEESVFQNEVKLLKEKGNNVSVYTRDNKELDEMNVIQKLILPFITIFSWKTYKEVKKIIKKNNIEIVHVHNYLNLISPSVYYAALKCGVPVVQTIHHYRLNCPATTFYRNGKICDKCVNNLFKSLPHKCYRNSILSTFGVALMVEFHKFIGTYGKINYICLTEFNKNQLLRMNTKHKKYIDEKKVYIKPNYSNFQHEVIPFNKRKNQIIYAGRLYEPKGIRYLVEAWQYVKNYELLIFGAGPLEEWCKEYIKDNKLTNVKMMGVIANSELVEYVAEAKAQILPTQWFEGFPMVLVEAFACGTPFLGSDIGNVNDIIKEGYNGLHFKHDNPKDIARAVNQIFDMVDTTKKCSEELYSPESNYKMLIDIYNKCITNFNNVREN